MWIFTVGKAQETIISLGADFALQRERNFGNFEKDGKHAVRKYRRNGTLTGALKDKPSYVSN